MSSKMTWLFVFGIFLAPTVNGMKLTDSAIEETEDDLWTKIFLDFKAVHDPENKIGMEDAHLKQALHDILKVNAGLEEGVAEAAKAKAKEFTEKFTDNFKKKFHETLHLRQLLPPPKLAKVESHDQNDKLNLRELDAVEMDMSMENAGLTPTEKKGSDENPNWRLGCSCPAFFAAMSWIKGSGKAQINHCVGLGGENGPAYEPWQPKVAEIWDDGNRFTNMGPFFARKMAMSVSLGRSIYGENDDNAHKKFVVEVFSALTGFSGIHFMGDMFVKGTWFMKGFQFSGKRCLTHDGNVDADNCPALTEDECKKQWKGTDASGDKQWCVWTPTTTTTTTTAA